MANQLKMAEVQAIISLARNSWSNRHIARQLGVHRDTGGRYLPLAAGTDSKPASAPLGSEARSESAPLGPQAQVAGQASAAGPWREVILQQLEVGLSARRISQDLCC